MSDQTNARPSLMPVAVLNKRIDKLNTHAATLQGAYQDVAVQALMHLDATGDVGPLNRLQAGMPKGVRTNAMGAWILAHASVELNADAQTKKSMPFRYTKMKECKVDLAISLMWYAFMPEKPLEEVFDLQKAIHGLLQRAKGKTILLHGKQLSAEHAVDSLKTLAAMAGEEYLPEVKNPMADVSAAAEAAKGDEGAGLAAPSKARAKGGVKAAATQAA